MSSNLGLLRRHWEALGSELEKIDASEPTVDLLAEGEQMIDESLEGVERASAIVRMSEVSPTLAKGSLRWPTSTSYSMES